MYLTAPLPSLLLQGLISLHKAWFFPTSVGAPFSISVSCASPYLGPQDHVHKDACTDRRLRLDVSKKAFVETIYRIRNSGTCSLFPCPGLLTANAQFLSLRCDLCPFH